MICTRIVSNASVSEAPSSLAQRLDQLGLSATHLLPWLERFEKRMKEVREATDLSGGHIEEVARQGCNELERLLIQCAMQARADLVEVKCSHCGGKLVRRCRQKTHPIRTLCGTIEFQRTGG
ncbi:MAG: hypothetical protein AAB263_15015, partial [Planctomycetota bacterium]